MGAPTLPTVPGPVAVRHVSTRAFVQELGTQLDIALLGVCFSDWLDQMRRAQTLQLAHRCYISNVLYRRSWSVMWKRMQGRREKREAAKRWRQDVCTACLSALRRLAHLASALKVLALTRRKRRARLTMMAWARFTQNQKVVAACDRIRLARNAKLQSATLQAWSGATKTRHARRLVKKVKARRDPNSKVENLSSLKVLSSTFLTLQRVRRTGLRLSERVRRKNILLLTLEAFQKPVLLRKCLDAWFNLGP